VSNHTWQMHSLHWSLSNYAISHTFYSMLYDSLTIRLHSFAPRQLCYPDDTRSLLMHNLAAGLLLHVCHVLLLSWWTSCATQIWIATCSNLCNKLWKMLSSDWSIVCLLFFSNEVVTCFVFFTLFYPSTSPNASFELISFFSYTR